MSISYISPDARGGPMSVNLYSYQPRRDFSDTTELQFFYTEEDSRPQMYDMIGKGFEISPRGLSDTCIFLAKQWLHDCTHSMGKHDRCLEAAVTELPTRVIDVEDMRLHTRKIGETARYAALSHCWGNCSPVRTTMSNLDEHLKELPGSLPQTFADAIAVTKALEIRYLWIDSLCIIQDSDEDWSSEALHMAQVYSNAVVTISADAAHDSFGGFLSAPSRRVHEAKTLKFWHTDDVGKVRKSMVSVRERGKLGLMLPYHDWPTYEVRLPDWNQALSSLSIGTSPYWSAKMNEPPHSRLSTRGWVFQERCLSPRTLHFGPTEMAYECRSICTCECSTTSYRSVRKTSLLKYWFGNGDQLDEEHTYWRSEIVPEYTRLDLTRPTDRLVALAGLAEAFTLLRTGDTYLAGLWKKTLKSDLLWCVDPTRSSSRLRIAPTWSWGSVTGAVTYPYLERNPSSSSSIVFSPTLRIEDVGLGPDVHVTPSVEVNKGIILRGLATAVKVKGLPQIYKKSLDVVSNANYLLKSLLVNLDDQTGFTIRRVSTLNAEHMIYLILGYSATGSCGLLLKRVEGCEGTTTEECDDIPCFERIGYVEPHRKKSTLPYRPRRGSMEFDRSDISTDEMLSWDMEREMRKIEYASSTHISMMRLRLV
ncbi:heterokaryon incompatibility protein-domain-containing protein [Lophiotrema nucula]|uniref:Heterokaryon incompatibility protein-domain-containing protein n=1 Tax=Lophiotrema nucula TaxID=690887 RepID=A0A6A5YY13_9PLEO|nr:heterokaryon incompatibility protein-domain-containing protein [Lophiotrema nucula]